MAYSSSSSRARTYSQIYCNRGIKIQVDMVADRTQIEQRMTSGYSHLRCSEQVLRAAFLVVQSLDLNYFLARFSSYLIGRSLLLHLREIPPQNISMLHLQPRLDQDCDHMMMTMSLSILH